MGWSYKFAWSNMWSMAGSTRFSWRWPVSSILVSSRLLRLCARLLAEVPRAASNWCGDGDNFIGADDSDVDGPSGSLWSGLIEAGVELDVGVSWGSSGGNACPECRAESMYISAVGDRIGYTVLASELFALANLPVDAKLLDNEIFDMLSKQVTDAISNPKLPRMFQLLNSRYSEEIKLVLELLIFRLTVWSKNTSYGLLLQNLVMSDGKARSRKSKSELSSITKTLLLSHLVLNYAYKKLESYLYTHEEDDGDDEELSFWRSRLQSLVKSLANVLPVLKKWYTGLSLANFLLFLVNGRYPNLLTRLLRITYKPMVRTQVSFASNPETISYEFQDRQLVWNTLTEFLVFIMPMLSVPRVSKPILRLFHANQPPERDSTAVYKFLPERCCAICYQNTSLAGTSDAAIDDHLITNPYETSCGHVYCYVCLLNKLEESRQLGDESWQCLRCGSGVEYVRVFDGEVEEDEEDDEKEDEKDYSDYSDDSADGSRPVVVEHVVFVAGHRLADPEQLLVAPNVLMDRFQQRQVDRGEHAVPVLWSLDRNHTRLHVVSKLKSEIPRAQSFIGCSFHVKDLGVETFGQQTFQKVDEPVVHAHDEVSVAEKNALGRLIL
ncbi:hypothetical protein OGAPHI_002377 [Ogataea philodendri]|uniref:RING-type domain-containing protein n=1 Tax=Ogataea philodendri TaxID=1378263 RepID=A0A9P8PAK0_9ASCO|nr:uncharacterized protein OGAPHI_002377 [Ogataea philodendri]KAH3668623.1 hypothetical protein OGAPHI_002377 [Ogataea philodendri]